MFLLNWAVNLFPNFIFDLKKSENIRCFLSLTRLFCVNTAIYFYVINFWDNIFLVVCMTLKTEDKDNKWIIISLLIIFIYLC